MAGNESEQPSRSRVFVDISPLKHSSSFARLWAGNSLASIGTNMTTVAVGMHVYDLTRSTFAVSLVAVWSLGPMIIAGLWGGMLADVFDRRKLSLITATVSWLTVGALALVTLTGLAHSWTLYALAALNASAATILGATRMAIMPRLLPATLIPQASALFGITFGLSIAIGPALAGVFASTIGFGWTYLIDVLLFTAGFLGVFSLPPITPDGTASAPGITSLLEGWRFLRDSPNIRATFIVDIVAMTFGQPRATFPAIGMIALGGGYVTAGFLTTAVAVGTFISSVASGWFGKVQRQGKAITFAIAVYGAAILMFGAVVLFALLTDGATEAAPRWGLLSLAVVALAISGASDNVSAVFRSTILQVAAPDHMRGRMQGISTIVVTGGPRLGDMWAGMLTASVALWAPALIGGMLIVILIACSVRLLPAFQSYDARHPTP